MKLKPSKETVVVGAGYLAFMAVFYFWGITGARFLEFVTIALLTGFYALFVYSVKKIRKG
jgi:hypothetical protein